MAGYKSHHGKNLKSECGLKFWTRKIQNLQNPKFENYLTKIEM